MAAFEVIALDTATPQLRAPGAADTYTFPRAVAMTGALTYGGVTLNNAVTGTGNMVLSTSPTFTTPVLGTPSSGTLTSCTGLPLSTGVTGTLPVGNGGTGQTTYTDGQLLIGNSTGNTLSKATLTAGSGVTITNGPGNITIAASGGGGASPLTIQSKSAAYTVVAGDLGTIINCIFGSFTVSLTSAATLGAGFNCWIWNTGLSVVDTITIDPSGTQTIDGRTTLTLRRGEGTQIVSDGSNWITGDKKTMRLYAENSPDSAVRPSATGSASIAIGASSQSAGTDAIAIGSFTIAGNSNAISIGTSTQANPSYSAAIGNNSGGTGSQTATNFGAMSLGGSYASGSDSFAAAVANNTNSYGATGDSAIAVGYLARAQGSYSICLSSTSSVASGPFSIAIGERCTASAYSAVALGTSAISSIRGKLAYSGTLFAANGDVQTGKFVLRTLTINTNPAELATNSSIPGSDNKIILPNNSAYTFSGTIVARQQASAGTQSAAWRIEGLIRREATAGSTTLVASTVTPISNVPGWGVSLNADGFNGGLTIQVVGAAATNIRWVATIDTSEVTYA